jgi:hypothetical protein
LLVEEDAMANAQKIPPCLWSDAQAEVQMWKSGVSAKSESAMKPRMRMKKLDIAALQKAYDGVA